MLKADLTTVRWALERAAQIIETRGWTRTYGTSPQGPFDLLSAIQAFAPPQSAEYVQAKRQVAKVVGASNLVGWGAHTARNRKHVVTVLRKAAASCHGAESL